MKSISFSVFDTHPYSLHHAEPIVNLSNLSMSVTGTLPITEANNSGR